MQITAEMLQEPRWFQTIMLKSGMLAGSDRTRFIEKVGEHNLYLAIKCKSISLEKEQSLVNRLRQQAIAKARTVDNPKVAAEGMLALAEIDEKKLLEVVINVEFEKLLAIYQEIDRLNIKPPLWLSTSLAFKIPFYEYDYYEEFKIQLEDKEMLGNGVYSLSMVSYRTPDFHKVIQLVRTLQEEGVRLNVVAYNALINKSPEFATAKAWFEEMVANGLIPDEISYTSIINKSPDFATAKSFFEQMTARGLILNEISYYNTLINKSPDFATAKSFFEQLRTNGLNPDVFTYTTMLRQAPHEPFEETLALLEAMQAANIEPGIGREKQRCRHYTLEAIQPSVKKNRKIFREWANTKGSQAPVWQKFYAELLKFEH